MANMPPSRTRSPANTTMQTAKQLIFNLNYFDLRENAILGLSKIVRKEELVQDMAPLLWNSIGTMGIILQEVISLHRVLSSPHLSTAHTDRVCNAIILLKCLASHPHTKPSLLRAQFPIYLYPFLNTTIKSTPFENLRITSLGVITALVREDDDSLGINYLISSDIFPYCVSALEMGSELSKTAAAFLIHTIWVNDMALGKVCAIADRVSSVCQVLNNVVAEQPSPRVLHYIILCYLRLSDDFRARHVLRSCLPEMLRDGTFAHYFQDDPVATRQLQELLYIVHDPLGMTLFV